MDTTIVEGRSISKPPYFDGTTTNCTEWKERIKIFIQSVDFDLWLVIKNGPNIPKIMIDGIASEKSEDEFNGEDKKNVELEAKAKNILCCALNPDDLKRISSCQTAKEMWEELDREVTTSNVNTTPPVSQQTPAVALYDTPNSEFLEETSNDPRKRFLKLCVPIHKHALNGNWPAAKRILDEDDKLKNAAIANGCPTLLHIAAGANRIHFVKELLSILDDNDIALQDMKGNTAFCFAAAAGNIEIVDLLLDRNSQLPVIRDGKGYTPIQYAALQGRCKTTWHLYEKTIHCFEDDDWDLLFFACIHNGIYDLALKMVRDRNALAFARDVNEETALHILAQNGLPLNSGCHCPEHDHNPIMTNPGMKSHIVFQLVKFLWTTILEKHYSSKVELNKIINEPSQKVKKIMLPGQIKMRNSEGFTAQELFSIEHETLRENAESWMKKTAESCMLISTVIATGVFAAATTLPGGTDDSGKPHYLNKTSFLVFAISDAFAFISSATAILIFLSILVSRYGEYDFYKSLPLKLISGLITLAISATSMMVALSTNFFIIYFHGSTLVPSFISIFSFLPIPLYIGLQFSLFSDIINSTYYWRTLSNHGKNMIYVLEK
ncbi:uncharacterized protein [Medicago truncatula]|uniref:Ankyrin repeat plant-like protein n=1 Tax=Medicago truncatula TaxID=3880 RepID=A0A072V7U2_MEDTR|nr:uncharacterized protein LOC25488254 isoform X3 [Medicago truncatula]KEH37403.1 ankyrin repeat plant-like protein [Medicago truncatula]